MLGKGLFFKKVKIGNTYAKKLFYELCNKKKDDRRKRTMSERSKEDIWKNNILKEKERSLQNPKIFDKASKAVISGKIETGFELAYELKGDKFYQARVSVKRPSGVKDLIRLIIPEKLLTEEWRKEPQKGKWIEALGGLRTYDERDENHKQHLKVFLFVKKLEVYSEEQGQQNDTNFVYLKGRICRPTRFKHKLSGKKVTELCLAVNKAEKAYVYIPCLAWGKNAEKAAELKVRDQIELYGRFQSRTYFKRLLPDSPEGTYKRTYEVSIIKMRKVES